VFKSRFSSIKFLILSLIDPRLASFFLLNTAYFYFSYSFWFTLFSQFYITFSMLSINRFLFDYINCLIRFNKVNTKYLHIKSYFVLLFYILITILKFIMTRKNYNYLYDMIKQKTRVIWMTQTFNGIIRE
jgi:hypothetical protein